MTSIRHAVLIFLQVSCGFYLLADLVTRGSVSGLAALVIFTASWFAIDHIEASLHLND